MPEPHILIPKLTVCIEQPDHATWFAIHDVTEITYLPEEGELRVYSDDGNEHLMLDVTVNWDKDASIFFNGIKVATWDAELEIFYVNKLSLENLLEGVIE